MNSSQGHSGTKAHPAAKGVRQKESGKKVTKKVTKASEKVTEKWPKASRKRKKVIELLLPHSFCGTLKSSICESCLFSEGKTPEFTQKWAKFMNFSFWPFLWFGLPGRLLSHQDESWTNLGFEAFLNAVRGWTVHSIFAAKFITIYRYENRLLLSGTNIFHIVQRAPNPQPNLHSPFWAGSNGGRPQRGGTNLGVFVPVNSGIVYVPGSHPTPSSFWGLWYFFLVGIGWFFVLDGGASLCFVAALHV